MARMKTIVKAITIFAHRGVVGANGCSRAASSLVITLKVATE